jgi:DNA polymerase III delta prime subunit
MTRPLDDDTLRATLEADRGGQVMRAPFLLGLAGPPGVGKSTIARAVLAELGGVELKAGFALKAMLAGFYAAHGLDPAEINRRIEGDLKRVPCRYLCGRTPTDAQQTLGTEWGRKHMGAEIWLRAWEAAARRRLSAGVSVVNDSVRFRNEAEAIRGLGGIVVRLTGRVDARTNLGHIAEAGVSADFEIDNAGALGNTVARVVMAIEVRRYSRNNHVTNPVTAT